ncbi:MAG: hypothetical protein AAB448_01155 [Patescibacteria group bacterium]
MEEAEKFEKESLVLEEQVKTAVNLLKIFKRDIENYIKISQNISETQERREHAKKMLAGLKNGTIPSLLEQVKTLLDTHGDLLEEIDYLRREDGEWEKLLRNKEENKSFPQA